MTFKIHPNEQGQIAALTSPTQQLNLDDFIDLIGNLKYQGIDKLIIYKTNLSPDFFDLKTKLAGDILQKFSNYNVRLAIIGQFKNLNSEALKQFIQESNTTGQILFLENINQAFTTLK